MADHPLVCVVDDDESIRESLPPLLRELGYAAAAFSSAEEFLAANQIAGTKCLILDIAMPQMSGPELQTELKARRYDIPVIFITANGGASLNGLIEQGAIACLLKPFTDEALLKALKTALS
jgi:FixJ family two-component response regulator